LEAIEWLENRLKSQNLTLILVTHDRYFLDNVTNVIAELDNGKIYKHNGNYAKFLENKSLRDAQNSVEMDKAQSLLRKELDWIRKQPRARGTKAKYRVEAFEILDEKVNRKVEDTSVKINLGISRLGKKVLECEDVSFYYDEKLMLDRFTYAFTREDRIGIVGPNGVGKSTFLNLLTGKLTPTKGKVDKGENTKFGYYTQDSFLFDDNRRVIDVLKDVAETFTLKEGEQVSVSQLLQQFYFPPQKQYDLVGKLSGGEKRRLQLLRVLVERPNFLILDEPTNDLDIQTLNVLEDFLESFPACVIIVSHDRYFMDRLTDRLFVFEGNGYVRDFGGNYTDYRDFVEEQKKEELAQSTPAPKPIAKTVSNEKAKLNGKEKKEYEQLEKEIEQLEKDKSKIELLLDSGETDFAKINAWGMDILKINKAIDEKTDRWLALSLLV